MDHSGPASNSTPPSQRTLIYGGTFDPPHLAHARLPALAAEQLGCDRILYIPAAINPLKADAPPTSKEHRLAMLVLALDDVPNATISTIELDRPGLSYTIDTLRQLNAEASRDRGIEASGEDATSRYLLIGADQALEFHRWREWEEILKLATPAVMLRPPWTRESFAARLREVYRPDEAAHWLSWTLVRGLPLMDVSATELRGRLRRGESTEGQLSPAVADYIRVNGLYGVPTSKGP